MRDLFRSLHTLKGLSGMVGDACAERVAHALEDSLKAAERTGAPFDATYLDAVFSGVELLGRCIESRRNGTTPDIEPALDALARATPGARAAATSPARATPAVTSRDATLPVTPDDASAAGDIVHHFAFTPSLALTERGVGVDVVRTRLGTLGAILDAKPRIADGSVVFDFWVSVAAGRAPDAGWTDDGLQWTAAAPAIDRASTSATGSAGVAGAPISGVASGASIVRVDLARLDGVMRLVGDLVVSRTRLDDVMREANAGNLAAVVDMLEEANALMERQLRRLREGVTRIRLVPVGEVFERLRFSARDAIRESGKQVALTFQGQTTEIDKLVVDRMLEPLLHLVRNAVSHGIEAPDERRARGKPPEGMLTLRAAASGDRIIVEVEDDGAGIDRERVAARARALGLLAPGEATRDEATRGEATRGEPLSDERLLDVLCAPGFSTRDAADLTSGRGVGMDVVRSAIRDLSGDIALHTELGRGTRFVIELPLTLMILDAIMVLVAGQEMAVPQPALREILKVEASEVVSFENNDVVPYRGGVLPLLPLARLFGFAHADRARNAAFHVLVVGHEAAPVGLVVDRVVGLREIVVHPVADPLVALPGIAGATELADGRVSLILDTAALLRLGQAQRDGRAWRVRDARDERGERAPAATTSLTA
jgi:two-component system chemotaxis sensor kinase CheA